MKKILSFLIAVWLFFPLVSEANWYDYFHNPYTITPVQTSYSTPLNVTASCDYSAANAYGWNAFTQSANDLWACVGAENPSVMIDLGTASPITSYSMTSDSSYKAYMPTSWTVYGSNDSSCSLEGNWTEVDSQTGQTSWRANEMRLYNLASASTVYKCYKLVLPTSDIMVLAEWELSNYVAPASASGKSAQYLVVGGGGASSPLSDISATGGGGGGGVITGTLTNITPQMALVIVGRGGEGNKSGEAYQYNGDNSVFLTVTAYGGGYAGGDSNGNAGGSGGGAGGNNTLGGASIAGQGNAGGNGSLSSGGGGGGAGQVGFNGSDDCVTSGGGNGGAGIASSISGAEQYYGGGGGAEGCGGAGPNGVGGVGGGGPGGYESDGIANTGGGAGEIMAAHDVKSATTTKGLADADMGTSMTRAAAIQGGYLPSWSGTTAIYATVDATTGAATTLADLTQGSTTFYLVTERY